MVRARGGVNVYCCLCRTEIGVSKTPRLFIQPYAKLRTLLKDCLLRRGEFPAELIDDVVARSTVITFCKKHSADYLFLAFDLGYSRRNPHEELTEEEKKDYLSQSFMAETIIERQAQRERTQRQNEEIEWKWRDEKEKQLKEKRKKRLQKLQNKADEMNHQRGAVPKWLTDTIFDESTFLISGEEIRSLMNTIMLFNCSCTTPETNVCTEMKDGGAQAEFTCSTCDARNVWTGGVMTKQEEDGEDEMEEGGFSGEGAGVHPMQHLFYGQDTKPPSGVLDTVDVKQEVPDEEAPGCSGGDLDLHSTFASGGL